MLNFGACKPTSFFHDTAILHVTVLVQVPSQLGSELRYITQVTLIQETKLITVVTDSNLSRSCKTSINYQHNDNKNKEG